MNLDFALLEDVPDVLVKQVKTRVLDALPTEATLVSFQDCLKHLEDIKRSEGVSLIGLNFMGEVSGVISFVRRIMNKDSPSYEEVSKLSDFYTSCLKRMVNFYSISAVLAPAKGQLKFGPAAATTVYGLQALEYKIGKFQIEIKKGTTFDIEATEDFRRYEFAMTDPQRSLTRQWIQDVIKEAKSRIMVGESLKIKDVAECSSSSTSASSASKLALAKKLPPVCCEPPSANKPKLKAACEVDVGAKKGAAMMKYFGNGVLKAKSDSG
jgi:hypothetical protein